MERILSIEDLNADRESGYVVKTDQQEIELSIYNHQQCCEDFGYFWCNDNPEEFVGAGLLDITLTDTALNTQKIPSVYHGDVMFVNLVTDRGVLQFVAYNHHNGYYGHYAEVISNQLNHHITL